MGQRTAGLEAPQTPADDVPPKMLARRTRYFSMYTNGAKRTNNWRAENA